MKFKLSALVFALAPTFVFSQALDPALPITPELSRLQQLGPRALRENAPVNLRRLVQLDLFKVALEAEILFSAGQPAQSAQRYALVARVSDDPVAAKRASEIAASADNLPLAREMAQRWATLDATSTRAKEISTALALAEGDVSKALDGVVTNLPTEPAARSKAVVDLARTLVRGNDRVQALSLMRALSGREKSAAAYYGLALAEYASVVALRRDAPVGAGKADFSAVLIAAEQALAVSPGYAPAAALRAEALGRADASEARAYAQDYLRRNPQAQEVRLFLAQSLADAGQLSQARAEFLTVGANGEAQVKTEAIFAAAVIALRLKNPAQALEELTPLAADAGANPHIVRLYRGQALDQLKRRPEAIALWRQIARSEPVWREAQWRIAAAMARENQIVQARAFLDEAFAQDSDADTPVAIVQAHAGWYRETDQWQQALETLDAGLKQFPEQSELLYDSAMMADKLKRYDEMESRLRRVMTLKPDYAQAFNALAYSFAERNVKIADARALIDRAIALSPNDPAIMDSVGWVYFREGRLSESEQWLRKAYAKMPDGEIAAHLAEVLVAMGRRDEARKVLDSTPGDAGNMELVNAARDRFFPK